MSVFKRQSVVRGVFPSVDSDGFTLIELMITIMIIGILVCIAVPVYLSLTRSADSAVSIANERIAASTMDSIWFDLVEKGADTYRDPDPPPDLTGPKDVDAKYMSYVVPRTRWVEISLEGNRWRIGGIWKNTELIPGTSGPDNYYNWDLISGNICVLQDWYYWDNSKWCPNAHREYVFTFTLQKNGVTRYTQFCQGRVDISGEFDWNDGFGHP